jgi:hypothetical protein
MSHARGRRGMHIEFWLENQKDRENYEDLDVVGRPILKWILEKRDEEVWTEFLWLRIGTSGWLL